MATFIVSNRPVETLKRGKEVFKGGGSEHARESFRVARYLSKDDVTILPDLHGQSYDRFGPKGEGQALHGTEQLLQLLATNDPDGPPHRVALVLHGFNYTLKDSLTHIEQLQKRYRFGEAGGPFPHLIYFSWPSGASQKIAQYKLGRRRTVPTAQMLARFFKKLEWGAEDLAARGGFLPLRRRFDVFAHSLANEVLAQAAAELAEGPQLFRNLFLLNSDVEDRVLEPRGRLRALAQRSHRVHVYTHYYDQALEASSYLNRDRTPLGLGGPHRLERTPSNVFHIDTTFTAASTKRERARNHWGYLHRPKVIQDIRHVLALKRPEAIPDRTPDGPRRYRLG